MHLTYTFPHHLANNLNYDFQTKLDEARLIAEDALKFKREIISGNKIRVANGKKSIRSILVTTKQLKERGLSYNSIGSLAACAIVKKYAATKTIKNVKRIVIPIPHRNGPYENFLYKDKHITLNIKNWDLGKQVDGSRKKLSFYFNPGKPFNKFCQLEITPKKVHIVVEVDEPKPTHRAKYLGIDVNATHHIAVASDLFTGKVYKFDKSSANIRKKYCKKRAKAQKEDNKKHLAKLSGRVKNITKNSDHRMSNAIVQLAKKLGSSIVLEHLTGIRDSSTSESKMKRKNFVINSWSFYRLQNFICYKAKLNGVKVIYVDPAYTSKSCSRCGVVKEKRDLKNLKVFQCNNRKCKHRDHADANAGFNIAKRGQEYFINEVSDNLGKFFRIFKSYRERLEQ